MGKNLDRFFLILETYYGLKYGYNLERKINLLERLPEKWKKIGKKELSQKITYCEAKGYLARDRNDKNLCGITSKGLVKLIRHNAGARKKTAGGDSAQKLVFFDIPENRKSDRNKFRRFLKELGFRQLQQSAFLCSYDCGRELAAILNFLKLEEFVVSGIFYPDKPLKK